MNHEELLSKVNEGRTASVALQWLQPVFDGCEKELNDSMKTLFRAGKYTESILVSHVAQLVAIDTLREKLLSMGRAGETSAKQLRQEDDHGTTDPTF